MLIERERELAAIREAIERAAAGRGSLVYVEGPPGIGKSSLIAAAQEIGAEAGLTALSARAYELEGTFPHGVIRQLAEGKVAGAGDELFEGGAGLARVALGLQPAPAGVEPGELAVAHGVYWLLSNIAQRGPLLITVDDVHWADSPSLVSLAHLWRRRQALPVAVVIAGRPMAAAAPPQLAEIAADATASTLAPGPLSLEAAASVISAMGAAEPPPGFVAAAHEATGGNPYFLTELMKAAGDDGLPIDESGAERLAGLGAAAVSRSVLLRLRSLPDGATEVARAVAVLAGEASPLHVASLAGRSAEETGELVDALVQADVLAAGRPLTVAHPLVAEAIRGDMGEGEGSAMHLRAAKILDEEGASPERIAVHLERVDPGQDPWIAGILRAAARDARDKGALQPARVWLGRASAEGVGETQPALLQELGEVEWRLGNAAEGASLFRQAGFRAADDEGKALAALGLARSLASTLDVREARVALSEALESAPAMSRETRLRLEAERATFSLLTGFEVERCREDLEAFGGLAGQTVAEMLVLCSIAGSHINLGSAQEAREFALRGLAAGGLLAAGEGESFPYSRAVVTLALADDHGAARQELDLGLSDAAARGSAVEFAFVSAGYAMLAWMEGDLSRCEAMARQAIDPEIPAGFAFPVLAAYLALVLVERGELDEAEELLARSGVGPDLPPLTHAAHSFYARANLRRAQGRLEEALEDHYEQGRRAEHTVNRMPYPAWRLGAAECLVELGDAAAARELVERHREDARRWGTATALGMTDRVWGLTMEGEERIAALDRAREGLGGSPSRLEHARAVVDLGTALRAAERTGEAQEILREGMDLAGRCGSNVLQGRARDELVASGARPRRLQLSGPGSLTPSERRIAELAASGLTNASIAQSLFVTLSTVEKHLSSVYRKLEIGARSELAGALGD